MKVWMRLHFPQVVAAAGRDVKEKLKKWFGDGNVAVVEFDLETGTARVLSAKDNPS